MNLFRNKLTKILMSLCFGASIAPFYPASAANELIFGSVAMDIPAVMHRRLTPLTKYLSNELGKPVNLQLSPNMDMAITDVSAGKVDIAYLTPVAYLRAHENGAQLVAKTITNGQGSFKLMIVVQKDSPIKSVEDLAGKSFAFGDKSAILQRAVVVGAGMPIEKLGDHKFIGHYDNIARAVKAGDFDAGILKDTTALKWEQEGLRIIHTSGALPPYNIVVSKNVGQEVHNRLQKAFLKLDVKNPEHKEIIEALDQAYDGFQATNDSEYQIVRDLVKPFQKK